MLAIAATVSSERRASMSLIKASSGHKEGKIGAREPIPIPDNATKPNHGSQWERFLKAIRSRNAADLRCRR